MRSAIIFLLGISMIFWSGYLTKKLITDKRIEKILQIKQQAIITQLQDQQFKTKEEYLRAEEKAKLIIDEAKKEAQKMSQDAQEDAQEIIQNAENRWHDYYAQGYAEGFKDGLKKRFK